jgi:THO complex subunit 2
MLDAITLAAPEGGWQQNVSLEFLSMFWSLSMYDLYLPKTRYEAEIKRYKDKIAEFERVMQQEDEKTRAAKKSEVTKMTATIATLQEEMAVQKKQVDAIKKILVSKKDGFFVGVSKQIDQNKYVILEAIVQHCVRPRLLMSPIDAVYCSHFFFVLHEIDTPKYNLVNYFDKFIKMITPSIFCSTEYEASFLGHALNDMMTVLNRWATSQDNFINENGLRTGPYSKFLPLFSVLKMICY